MPNYINPDAPSRRFVAGAVCPRCGEMDKTVLIRNGGEQHRECVACGFAEAIEAVAAEEPPTRVSGATPGRDPLPHETPVQRVTIVDAREKHDE